MAMADPMEGGLACSSVLFCTTMYMDFLSMQIKPTNYESGRKVEYRKCMNDYIDNFVLNQLPFAFEHSIAMSSANF